jgi:hypothetical protein
MGPGVGQTKKCCGVISAMHMLIVLYHSEMIETETFSYFSNFLAGVTSGTRTTYHCAVPDLIRLY